MGGPILADPGNLSETGASLQTHVTFVDNLQTTLKTATGGATSALEGIPQLTGAASELEYLQGMITTILGCLTTALIAENANLQQAAQEFISTDATLAGLFSNIDQSLQTYIGFEPPAPASKPTQTQQPPKKQTSHPSFWSKMTTAVSGIGLLLAIIPTQVVGGGPEDPLADGASVEEGSAGVSDLVDAFSGN